MGGGLELGKHCHILEKCLLALLIPIPLYSYPSLLPTPVSPGKQIEKSQRRKPAYSFISVFFFFSVAQFQLLSAPMPQIL